MVLRQLAVIVAALCLAACSSAPPSATPTASKSPLLTPSLPASGALNNVYGSYRTDSGEVVWQREVARLGVELDVDFHLVAARDAGVLAMLSADTHHKYAAHHGDGVAVRVAVDSHA